VIRLVRRDECIQPTLQIITKSKEGIANVSKELPVLNDAGNGNSHFGFWLKHLYNEIMAVTVRLRIFEFSFKKEGECGRIVGNVSI
jgi:hypothetical protein